MTRPNFKDIAREYLRVHTGWATDKAIESLSAELERVYEMGVAARPPTDDRSNDG